MLLDFASHLLVAMLTAVVLNFPCLTRLLKLFNSPL